MSSSDKMKTQLKVPPFLRLKLYGPIVGLLVLVLLVWVPHFKSKTWSDPYYPIPHFNETFTNTEVLLDGHAYDHCTFSNVTFVYNGTTAPQITFADVKGSVRYRTDSSAIGGMVSVLRALGDLPNVNVGFSNPNNIVRAPGEPVR